MRLMNYSRSVGFGVGGSRSPPCTSTSASNGAAPAIGGHPGHTWDECPGPAPASPQARCASRTSSTFPRPNVVEAMLKMANVTRRTWSTTSARGDGRIPITAAQKYGARAVGIDIDPQRIKEANENVAKAGVGDKVKFLNQDLFDDRPQRGHRRSPSICCRRSTRS